MLTRTVKHLKACCWSKACLVKFCQLVMSAQREGLAWCGWRGEFVIYTQHSIKLEMSIHSDSIRLGEEI